jgi:hypothetical protein
MNYGSTVNVPELAVLAQDLAEFGQRPREHHANRSVDPADLGGDFLAGQSFEIAHAEHAPAHFGKQFQRLEQLELPLLARERLAWGRQAGDEQIDETGAEARLHVASQGHPSAVTPDA